MHFKEHEGFTMASAEVVCLTIVDSVTGED